MINRIILLIYFLILLFEGYFLGLLLDLFVG